jgi:hypothetical protein
MEKLFIISVFLMSSYANAEGFGTHPVGVPADVAVCENIPSPSQCEATPGCRWLNHPSYLVGCWTADDLDLDRLDIDLRDAQICAIRNSLEARLQNCALKKE